MTQTFEILTLDDRPQLSTPGALLRVFQACRELVAGFSSDIRAGVFSSPVCARCSRYRHPVFGDLRSELLALKEEYPLRLESPFEEVSTIAGGIWQASHLCGGDDALLKLCFQPGTMDLPLHSHDHSDRVVFVVEGSGSFEFIPERDGTNTTSTEITSGDLLMFARGMVHSFRTPQVGLQLISYHSPFLDLRDERQYTVYSQS